MSDMDKFPETEKRWFMHVGYLAQNWAGVETMLDGHVRHIHVHYDGAKIEQEPPQSFNRKRTYLRKAFARHPKLKEHAEAANSLLDEATRLAEIRNWTLHSGWSKMDPDNALLGRYSRSERMLWEQQEFTIDDIYKAAADSVSLAFALSFFGQFAFGLQTQEQIEQVLREITGKLGAPFPGDDPAG